MLGLDARSRTESECSKTEIELDLLHGSRPKCESLPISAVVHEHFVCACCTFSGIATRQTLAWLHRPLFLANRACKSSIRYSSLVTCSLFYHHGNHLVLCVKAKTKCWWDLASKNRTETRKIIIGLASATSQPRNRRSNRQNWF